MFARFNAVGGLFSTSTKVEDRGLLSSAVPLFRGRLRGTGDSLGTSDSVAD